MLSLQMTHKFETGSMPREVVLTNRNISEDQAEDSETIVGTNDRVVAEDNKKPHNSSISDNDSGECDTYEATVGGEPIGHFNSETDSADSALDDQTRNTSLYSSNSTSSESAPRSAEVEGPGAILASLADSSDSSPPPEAESCASETESCASETDSCPSDTEESETDTFVETPLFESRLKLPVTNNSRRGRMSVITRPTVSKLEISKTMTKRISKSCGAINELSEEFIEHLVVLKSVQGTVSPEAMEQFRKMNQQANAEAESLQSLKRSNSQTITKEEIRNIDKDDRNCNIWTIPSLVRKSKIALAFLFIGAKLGAPLQNNLNHLNQLALEERDIMTKNPSSPDSPAIPKMKISRAFSFSKKPKPVQLGVSNKRFSASTYSLSTTICKAPSFNKFRKDIIEEDEKSTSDDENDAVGPLTRKRSITDPDIARLYHNMALSQRCTSLTTLTPGHDGEDDLHLRGHHRTGSTDILIHTHVQSCDSLNYKGRETSDGKRPGSNELGKSYSSNESSSDSDEERFLRGIIRSKSISSVTRSMIFNKKSVLKKKIRCPPHNFVLYLNKEELSCEECSTSATEDPFVKCHHCDYLVHKACSMQVLEPMSPTRDKKSLKKLAWSTSNPVNILNKRQPSHSDVREIIPQNGLKKSRDTPHDTSFLRVSQRSSSPTESDDELSDESEDYTDHWRRSMDSSILSCMQVGDEKRLHSIYELINTERNHIRNLKILIKLFKVKLKRKLLITEEECSEMFPAADELLESCTNFYNDLKKDIIKDSEPHKNHKIGEILVQHFSHNTRQGRCLRDSYSCLSAHNESAVQFYRDKCKDKGFKTVMDLLESKKICNRQTYPDIMLATTTRLTKFPPLLQALLKHTPTSHPDHKGIDEAITVIKDALNHIDSQVMEENQRRDLELCQSKFEVKGRCSRYFKQFDLSSSERTLLNKDCLTLKTKEKDSKITMFLYNDYIVLLKEKENKLVLNFDDPNYPVIMVKDCLAKENAADPLCFMIISRAISEKPESSLPPPVFNKPNLYVFFANSVEQKNTWIKTITEAASMAKTQEIHNQTVVSSDENSSSDNEQDTSLLTETIDSLDPSDTSAMDAMSCLPDSSKGNLHNIEEQLQEYSSDEYKVEDEGIDKVVSFLTQMGGGKKHPSFNRTQCKGARRTTSLLLVDKQRIKDENRRHTTCLSKEELDEAISNTNQTLQDNPVRQKSSDSGYAPEDTHTNLTSPVVILKMRDVMLWMVQDAKRKDDIISQQGDLIQKQGEAIARIEEELKQLKNNSRPDYNYRHRQRTLNQYSSITEEIAEPQTRV